MFVAVQPPDNVLDHLDDFLDARRDAADFLAALTARYRVADFEVSSASLEDAFLEAVERGDDA